MISLIAAFAFTFIIEGILICFFIKKLNFTVISYILLINLLTWPIANLAYALYWNILAIESAVIIIESILIMLLLDLKYQKALLISFIANLLSSLLGSIIF